MAANKKTKKVSNKITKQFSIAALLFLILGLLSRAFLDNPITDIQIHDTYFVVANFRIVLLSTIFLCGSAVVYFVVPRLTGIKLNQVLGRVHFWITSLVLGAMILTTTFSYLFMAVVPRRYYSFDEFDAQLQFWDLNNLLAIMVLLFLFAQLVFLINLIYSFFKYLKQKA